MDAHRTQRVSEALREELSEIIGYELSDPRVLTVDVTEVLISPNMRHACVRVHVGGGEDTQEAALQALDGARHYLRRQLAGRLSLFRVPALHFEADLSLETETRVEQLLKRIRKGRPRPAEPPEKEP
jgi:ribosome-binding factor A